MINFIKITGSPGHFPALDGLRAIAIMLVLFRHAVQPFYKDTQELFSIGSWDLAIPFMNGWAGVDLFFVLSGFLVGYHLLKRWPQQASFKFFRRYWLKRLLRTFPVYYAMILIILLGIIPGYQHTVSDIPGTLFVHMIFMQDYMGADIVVTLWSLATEEKFYFIAPFLLWGILKIRKPSVQVIMLLLLIIMPLCLRLLSLEKAMPTSYGEFFWNVRAPFHLAIDGLLLGVLCAVIIHFKLMESWLRAYSSLLLKLGSLLVIALIFSYEWMNTTHWYLTAIVLNLFPLAFSMILIGCVYDKRVEQGVLASRKLLLISRLSYSLYVVHFALIPISLKMSSLLYIEYFYQYSLTEWQQFLLFLPIYFTLCFLSAIVMHLFVEKPFLKLKDTLPN